jgi:hypothetical protein
MLLKCSSWPRFCTIRAYSLRFISPASMLPKNFSTFLLCITVVCLVTGEYIIDMARIKTHMKRVSVGLPCMQESDLDMAACWVGLHDYGLD